MKALKAYDNFEGNEEHMMHTVKCMHLVQTISEMNTFIFNKYDLIDFILLQ
jgi:hypothetical protein